MRVLVVEDEPTMLSALSETLPHIWDRFTRIDPSRSRESGGRGSGVAIVPKAVEAMHGHVVVTSEVDTGSTFSIILPAGSANV